MNLSECAICHHQFGNSSRKFYCCKPQIRYCILCKYKSQCKYCHNQIRKQVNLPKCRQCHHSTALQKDYFFHQACNNYICPKCLLSRTRNSLQKQITLLCGHKQYRDKVTEFLTNFCRSCGTICDSILDYDLLNGEKCCFSCFKYNQTQIHEYLIKCMSCDQAIRKFKDAGTCENDIVLCKNCVAFSNIEESNIMKKNQEVRKSRDKYNDMDHKKQSNYKGSVQEKIRQQKFGIRQIDSEIIVQDIPQKNSKEKDKDLKNTGKISQKQEEKIHIKNLQDSNKQMSNSQNKGIRNLKKTILNKFPSQDNIVFDSLKDTKMKKHLSMETYVQAMIIDIQNPDQQTQQCAQCGYIVNIDQMYNLNEQEKENKQAKLCCTLCYTLLRKNQLLSFNSSFNNLNTKYHSTLQNSRNRGASSQKHNFKKIQPSHHTQSKQINHLQLPKPDSKMNGKLSGTFGNQRNYLNRQYTNIRYDNNRNQNFQKCQKCQQTGQTLIRTTRDGNLCFKCYSTNRQIK